MTNDPGLMQLGTRNSMLHKFAASRSFAPLSSPIFLTLEEVLSAIAGRLSRERSATGVR
jgi:hypothetical protein